MLKKGEIAVPDEPEVTDAGEDGVTVDADEVDIDSMVVGMMLSLLGVCS